MKEGIAVVVIMVLLAVAVPALLPDYDKYVAGGYRESVDCVGPAPYCWFVQWEYKE